MIKYVVGFIFSEDGKDVLLIRKTHPDWQKGRLNGIGGKADHWVEETEQTRRHIETPYAAMIRECEEETGLKIDKWQNFLTCIDSKEAIELYCFRTFTNAIHKAQSITDEHVSVINAELASNLSAQSVIGNIRFILRMAMDKNIKDGVVNIHLDRS